MTKLTTLLLLCVFIFSCKNTTDKESTTAENKLETKIMVEKTPEYNISLAQWSVHVPIEKGIMDPYDFADYAKNLGFTGVEYVDQLYKMDESLSFREGVMKLARTWKERNDKAGVDVVLVMIDMAGELVDPSEEKRKEAIEKHKVWVDAAVYLGAPSLRVNLFGINEPESWHKTAVASLKDLCTYAGSKNIKILSENHAQLSNNAEKLAAVIAEVNMPSCGTLPDFGNWCVMREGGSRWGPSPCIEEYDRYKGMAELLPYAGGVSAKSNYFDENGDELNTDYYQMMQLLKNANFSGYIGVEFEDDYALDPKEGILATKALILKAAAQAK